MSTKESIFVLLQLALTFFVKSTSSQDVLLNLFTKKVVAVTSDKFLSLTLDPAVLLTGDVLASSTELSTNMAKALAPGYVRIAGPRSNSYTFERSLFPQTGYEDPDLMFSEAHWVLVQQWAQRSGLDVVSSLTPQRIENDDQATSWDPRNSLDLISFSDHMGYNISWQLGYECQTRCDISGVDFGKDVARLRNMLGAFPRYSNSIIAGPDIVSFRGKQQQQYIQDYLNAAGNALSVVTWHPDFAGITLDSDGVALQMDTLAADKDLLYKAMGRSVSKKPLWIAESKPEECKRQFLGALVWARRLGNAAKLGVQVIMRQPDASSMFQPTPDYWVSLLHKTLVGREVLDAKLTSGNKTNVNFYCHCTKPSVKYDRGAVTIFGINLTPGRVSVGLKGLKIKAVHKYILMPGYDTDDRMFAETVLLNNEPLAIVNGKNIPDINPDVSLMGRSMTVKLPSGGIGFWVIPGARVKSCLGHDDDYTSDKNLLLKKLTKKLDEPEIGDENFGHEVEEENRNQDSEIESAEDIKSLLKSKKKKRTYRHSDETDGDQERRFKRIDTKKELEKLEKLLKRNNNNEEKKGSHSRGRVGLTIFESGENGAENTSDEDAGVLRLKKNDKTENSGEEIRAKLEEYKNKLVQYENRKKNDEARRTAGSQTTGDQRFANYVDTQKAVEALGIISRAQLGTSDELETRNLKPLNLGIDVGEEMMIEELEKAGKIKRMTDPKSVGKIYELLAKNSAGDRPRGKRDLEKLLGDDPLGLRKDGLFRKRLRNDEVKERRLERRHRKKDKEETGVKKELSSPRYDPRIVDSNENNFYGFPEMKPLENFPQGDVFLAEGSSSEEKSHDYDYVREDEDEEASARQKKRGKNRRGKKDRDLSNNRATMQDETWVEESNSNLNHAPNEFFERLNLPKVAIKTQWKDHGELYEPEALQDEQQKTQESETLGDAVLARDRPDERDDKRAKETAVKKLINYYDNSEVLRAEDRKFESEKQRPKGRRKEEPRFRAETTAGAKRTVKENARNKPEEIQSTERFLDADSRYDDNAELGSLEFVNSKEEDDYSEEIYEDKKRAKRRTASLDSDVFGQEMIREDAGNLRDCKCRVIRGTGKTRCKNCRKNQRRQRDVDETKSQDSVSYIEPDTDNVEQSLIDQTTTTEEIIADNVEPTEVRQAEYETQQGSEYYSKEAGEAESFDKNSEIDEEKKDEDSMVPESLGPSTDDTDSQVIGSEPQPDENKNDDEVSDYNTGARAETGTEETGDDMLGAKRLDDDGKDLPTAQENLEDQKFAIDAEQDDEERQETDVIEENTSDEDTTDDILAKRHLPEIPDANLDAESSSGSTKFSLGTGASLGSSLNGKADKENRLKFAGLKSDSLRNKFALNTEALSALIKESESKKAEVINRALESSAKLKSVENTKYAEYQRKRAEKLTSLKDKLRERKAKVLQQYRQELLEALNKCDDEVERNLKRREVWDDFNDKDELQELVDKDKIDYLIMNGNRPVDYDDDEEGDDERLIGTEERRYYPKIEGVQPVRAPRERKIPNPEYRGYFYGPKTTRESSIEDQSSAESSESYYAIVESLENPMIYHKQHLKNELRNNYNGEKSARRDRLESEKYAGHSPGEEFYRTVLPNYHQDSNPVSYYNEFPAREEYLLQKTHEEEASGVQNTRYENERGDSWGCLTPDCRDGILHHRQYSRQMDLRPYKTEEFAAKNFDTRGDFSVRRERDIGDLRSNYVCLRDDSKEDFGEDEKRVFKIVRNGDHYEAVPIAETTEDNGAGKQRKSQRRVAERSEKVRNKRRKYSTGVLTDEQEKDEIDYRLIGDEINRLDLGQRLLSPEEYELLMLIPVKKHKLKRQRRDLDNNIDRDESYDEINEVWDDREEGNRLQEYIDARDKGLRDFKQAQDNLNKYLETLNGAVPDPRRIDNFKKVILNLGSRDQEGMAVVAEADDELDGIHLGEYLKQEVLKKVADNAGEKPEEQTSSYSTLFDAAMPKLETTINEELEKVGNLTDSLEDFIEDFDKKFNTTSEIEGRETGGENTTGNKTVSLNIFHRAIEGVKKFFSFLNGVSLIFRNH